MDHRGQTWLTHAHNISLPEGWVPGQAEPASEVKNRAATVRPAASTVPLDPGARHPAHHHNMARIDHGRRGSSSRPKPHQTQMPTMKRVIHGDRDRVD
jgi:hypothetical protein